MSTIPDSADLCQTDLHSTFFLPCWRAKSAKCATPKGLAMNVARRPRSWAILGLSQHKQRLPQESKLLLPHTKCSHKDGQSQVALLSPFGR